MLLVPFARGDVSEDDSNSTAGPVLDSERVEFQNPPVSHETALEPDGFPRRQNGVKGIEPFLRLSRKRLSYGLPDHLADAALHPEGRVGGEIAKIDRLIGSRFDLLDDAKALIDSFKQRSGTSPRSRGAPRWRPCAR